MESSTVDLTSPQTFDDWHTVYGRLSQLAPVQWNESLGGWVLTRHRDVKAALKDPRLSVEKLEPFAARAGGDPHSDAQVLANALADWMVFKDPPRHGHLRRAMQNAFMARDIPSLAPMVRAVVDEAIAPLVPAPGERGRAELLDVFAAKVPAVVISELFGLAPRERAELRAWSVDLGEFVLGSTDSPHRREKAAAAVRAMSARFRELVQLRRAAPSDDFTSYLVRDGEHLSDEEIVHTLILVLFAGHETTANLIANGLLTLLNAPELMAQLAARPALIEAAVEEFLRLEGPVHMVLRIATQAVEYGGVSIEAGARLHLALNAANRDPAVFDHPGELDLDRRRFMHVSFGPGTHMCLGAPLARLVGRIALTALITRLHDFQLEAQALQWRPQLIAHGLRELPVSFLRRE